jgi:hypothetical protein
MVEQSGGSIRAVAWSEVFPWLRIVRAFRLAISVRALLLGAAGILLTVVGWGVVGAILLPPPSDEETAGAAAAKPATCPLGACIGLPLHQITASVPNKPRLLSVDETDSSHPMRTMMGWGKATSKLCPWMLLTTPARQGLAGTGGPLSHAVYILLCGLWAAAVWALFGAAICRTAAVQLAADEQIGWGSALRFAFRKWPSYFAAPLLPVGGVLLAAIPVLVLGWIMRADVGLVLGAFLWPLVLAAGFIMTLLLLGVLFGWPLMWGAISTEGTDSFDALSRSYAYTFQRPLHYLFYAAVATLIGWLGWLLVREFAAGVIWMGYWAAGWGSGSERIAFIMGPEGAGSFGAGLIRFWAACVKLLAVGYLFSYFWTASAAIYFLLRRDVDHTEMDEVFLDADQSEPMPELSTIGMDQANAPAAKENVADSPNDNSPTDPAKA